MVRQLGGHMLDRSADLGMLLAQAKETLKEALWIGMHDTLLQDLARLSAILKVELEPMYSNVTPGCRSLSDVDPAITKRLSELSTYDLELWNWMKASIS
jgi:hypothetical protein